MKKIFLLSLLFAWTGMVFADNVMKVAILEVVDKEKKLEYGDKLMLRSNLTRAVTNTDGYEAFERADIDAIMQEHDFQRTGNVSDKDIKKIGEMTGAAYVLVAEGALVKGGIYLTAKILNVETTKVEVTDNILLTDASSTSIQNGCRTLATKMFGALAGTSTTVNKFFTNMFAKSPEQRRADSIAAAQKAQEAAMAAQLKEQRRQATEQARQERAAAEEQARRERAEAEAKVREEKRLAKEQAAAAQAEREKYYLTKLSGSEYEYMGSVMDKKAYANFLQNNCPTAYNQYKKGKVLVGTGWGLFGAGVALAAVGGGLIFVDYALIGSGELFYIGAITAATGGVCTLASIPVLCVGYNKRDNAYKVYNEKCSSPSVQQLSLNLISGQNGLGLALNF